MGNWGSISERNLKVFTSRFKIGRRRPKIGLVGQQEPKAPLKVGQKVENGTDSMMAEIGNIENYQETEKAPKQAETADGEQNYWDWCVNMWSSGPKREKCHQYI